MDYRTGTSIGSRPADIVPALRSRGMVRVSARFRKALGRTEFDLTRTCGPGETVVCRNRSKTTRKSDKNTAIPSGPFFHRIRPDGATT